MQFSQPALKRPFVRCTRNGSTFYAQYRVCRQWCHGNCKHWGSSTAAAGYHCASAIYDEGKRSLTTQFRTHCLNYKMHAFRSWTKQKKMK